MSSASCVRAKAARSRLSCSAGAPLRVAAIGISSGWLYAAWNAGAGDYVPFAPAPTAADGIATVRPVRTREVLAALRRSQGGVVAVPEPAIAPALRALGRTGLFVEPTAATAAAAVSQLLAAGTIRAEETTVAVLTGHGLKATDKIADLLGL